MKHPSKLSKSFIERVAQPGRYGDGRGGFGLSLLVKSRAAGGLSKSWSQRIIIDGKPVNIGLGAFPVVNLEEARAEALKSRRAIWQGRDPRKQQEAKVLTFAEVSDKVIELHAATWRDGGKSAAQWRASLRDYALPVIGNKRIDRIGTADVLAVLTPIWNEKRETARRVRQRIGAVMKWAVASGLRDDNPAGDAIAEALPKSGQRQQHQRALPHGQVSTALRTVAESNAYPLTVYALEFLTLTATRSGEVRGARWEEVDLEAKTWTIPPERMKTGVEHRAPLSSGALAVLDKARELGDGSGLVFPSVRGGQLSDNTLSKLLRENNIKCVPHGMRSSFRDWAAESGASREVAEAALAHTVKNAVEAAYFRSDLYAARVELMQAWSDYLSRHITSKGYQIPHAHCNYGA